MSLYEIPVIGNGIRIEKGIPVPKEGQRTALGWDRLEVGDSVLVERRNTCINALTWAKRNGRKFTTRKNTEKPYGFRIWRVE